MTEPHRPRVKYVIGPDGSPLTIADLPAPGTKRWVIRRKAEVVAAVRGGLLSLEEACSRYTLTVDEFLSWQFSIDQHGLAGLRIGYAIGQPALLAAMNKLKTPFNTSGVAQAAALAALDDKEHVERCIATNARERRRLTDGLAELGLRPVESETNFVFMEVGPEAKAICDELLREGVIVRPLGWMGFPEAMRISVGTAEENDKCLTAMAQVLAKRGRARVRPSTGAQEGELATR